MNKHPLSTTIFLIFSALVLPAKAQLTPMSPELKAFLMRPDQQQVTISMMGQQWRALVGECQSPKVTAMNVLIDKPPTINQAGVPTSGEWRMVGHIEGCGATHIFSLLYFFAKDGQMKTLALLPGTTIADVRLQHDALMYAAAGMANLMPSKDCKDIKYTDTKFVGFGEANPQSIPGRVNRAWTEEWTVKTCGVAGIVTMHFTPDATGTNITSEPNKTRRISP
jgi:hypothetical protein